MKEGAPVRLKYSLILLMAHVAAAGPIDSRFSKPDDWLSYDRDNTGQRYSPLAQITPANVRRLAVAWAFQFPRIPTRSEATPIVRDGIMYITVGGEEAHALDARTGRVIWSFEYAPPAPPQDGAPGGIARRTNWNRGFGIFGNRLFMATDDCALIALDTRNGSLLWRQQLADPNENYNTTAAPLVVNNLVLLGVRGGDTGRVRGFVDAFEVETGKRSWRFYTVPAPGEPGSETWPKVTKAWKAGGGATWTAGTYDPE